MLECIIMLIGAIVGYLLLKINETTRRKISSYNNTLQLITVALIIFIMGVNLGSIDEFASKMVTLGLQSLIFAIVPTLFSIIIVYYLSQKFIVKK